MTPRFTAQGKQVLDCGEHYADARDQLAATTIATVLNDLPALFEVYVAARDYLHSVHRSSTWETSQRLSRALNAFDPAHSIPSPSVMREGEE